MWVLYVYRYMHMRRLLFVVICVYRYLLIPLYLQVTAHLCLLLYYHARVQLRMHIFEYSHLCVSFEHIRVQAQVPIFICTCIPHRYGFMRQQTFTYVRAHLLVFFFFEFTTFLSITTNCFKLPQFAQVHLVLYFLFGRLSSCSVLQFVVTFLSFHLLQLDHYPLLFG